MKVLVACEESQAVTIELRKLGHEAYSCDIIECSGGFPEWHIKGNALKEAYSGKYDMMIAFPPCTFLTVTGNKWMKPEYKERFPDRPKQRADAIEFFTKLHNAPIEKIAIENPVGIMSSHLRKPDQIVHPYFFGDEAQKKTCLWLKNLPKLFHLEETDWFAEKTHVDKGEIHICKSGNKMAKWYSYLPKEDRAKVRSKTFPGIAKAMAEQWAGQI